MTAVVPGLELDHNGNFKSFDFEAQVHSVFANVKAILEQHGSAVGVNLSTSRFSWSTCTATSLRSTAFTRTTFPILATQPCRTTLAINRLPTPIAIELKCIASVE